MRVRLRWEKTRVGRTCRLASPYWDVTACGKVTPVILHGVGGNIPRWDDIQREMWEGKGMVAVIWIDAKRGGGACLLICKHDHFTPTREMRRRVGALVVVGLALGTGERQHSR